MLSNTLVKLGGVFVVALPAVFLGGAVYSKLTGGELKDGFLKIYEVLYIIPGAQQPAQGRQQLAVSSLSSRNLFVQA